MNPFLSANATRHVEFRDARPPQEVQFDLERDLLVRLPGALREGGLEFKNSFNSNGATCQVVLRFEAALPDTNAYSVNFILSWEGLPAAHQDYHRQGAEGWLDLWTHRFTPTPPPRPEENSPSRYGLLTEEALAAEAACASVGAVQQEILAALRAGARFFTAHKEGGTVVSYQNDHYLRADYGESEEREIFPDEAALLVYLRRLYHWETGRHASPQEPSETDRWTLILRLLRPVTPVSGGRGLASGGVNGTAKLHAGHTPRQILSAFLIAGAAVGTIVVLRGGPSHFRASSHPQPPPPALTPLPPPPPPPQVRPSGFVHPNP